MIVKGKYEYKYSTVNLWTSVAKRFRSFSRKIAKTHSETLTEIMDFFEWHGFSPSERFEKSLGKELIKNRKRSDVIIAIIRDIEKSQTKPTNAMLLKLFEEAAKEEEEEEEFDFGKPTLISENEELVYYRKEYQKMQEKNIELKHSLNDLLDKIVVEKRSFRKDYLKLNLTQKEYENFKEKYEI